MLGRSTWIAWAWLTVATWWILALGLTRFIWPSLFTANSLMMMSRITSSIALTLLLLGVNCQFVMLLCYCDDNIVLIIYQAIWACLRCANSLSGEADVWFCELPIHWDSEAYLIKGDSSLHLWIASSCQALHGKAWTKVTLYCSIGLFYVACCFWHYYYHALETTIDFIQMIPCFHAWQTKTLKMKNDICFPFMVYPI